MERISSSRAPSNTGLAVKIPRTIFWASLGTSLSGISSMICTMRSLDAPAPSKAFLMYLRITSGPNFFSSISSTRQPMLRAPQPRWVSRIWPTFMREGTPSGLRTMSTGRPSSR